MASTFQKSITWDQKRERRE